MIELRKSTVRGNVPAIRIVLRERSSGEKCAKIVESKVSIECVCQIDESDMDFVRSGAEDNVVHFIGSIRGTSMREENIESLWRDRTRSVARSNIKQKPLFEVQRQDWDVILVDVLKFVIIRPQRNKSMMFQRSKRTLAYKGVQISKWYLLNR